VARGCVLAALPIEAWKAQHPSFDESVFDAIRPEVAVERRDVVGGPARAQVASAVEGLVQRLAARSIDAGREAQTLGAGEG